MAGCRPCFRGVRPPSVCDALLACAVNRVQTGCRWAATLLQATRVQRQAAVAREVDPRRVAEPGREWYTLSEVAQVLRVSRQAVHARVKKLQLDEQQVDGL